MNLDCRGTSKHQVDVIKDVIKDVVLSLKQIKSSKKEKKRTAIRAISLEVVALLLVLRSIVPTVLI